MKSTINKYLKTIWHSSAALNNQLLKSLVEPANSATILDLGCNNGKIIINRVRGKINKPTLYGVDIKHQLVMTANKNGIFSIQMDLETLLPFKDNSFDLITANQIIEHLINTDQLLAEIHRVLKPKGYLLLSTENLSSWHNIFALTLGWQAFSQDVSSLKPVGNPLRLISSPKPSTALHIKIFTLKGLLDILKLHGFTIEKYYGAGYYPLPTKMSKIFSKIDPNHTAFIGVKARKQ